MSLTFSRLVRTLAVVLLAAASLPVWATQVRFETPLGGFTVDLFEDEAPVTVANFLQYVESGAYENSIIHRKVPGFVIQGGGVTFTDEDNFGEVPTEDPIVNESGLSNLRGTIAMARAEDPDSATSQWFINLRNNSSQLDGDDENAGYAVFGEVTGDGMAVVNLLGSIHHWNFQGALSQLPLLYFGGLQGEEPEAGDFLYTDISVLEENPAFRANAGLSGGWFDASNDGQGFYLEVLPQKGLISVGWYAWDTELPPAEAMAVIGDPGQRWLTALSQQNSLTGEIVLDVYNNAGGLFDTPNEPVQTQVGTLTLSFEDCSHGQADYDLTEFGVSGSIPITRIASDNVELCETLAEQAAIAQ